MKEDNGSVIPRFRVALIVINVPRSPSLVRIFVECVLGRSTFRHHQCLSFSVTGGVSERVDKESPSKEENEATEWCRSMPRRETPGYPGLSFRENLTMNG